MIFNKQHTSLSINTRTTYTQTVTGDPCDVTFTKIGNNYSQDLCHLIQVRYVGSLQKTMYIMYTQSISTPRVLEPLHLVITQRNKSYP